MRAVSVGVAVSSDAMSDMRRRNTDQEEEGAVDIKRSLL